MADLNPPQLKAVLHTGGPLLVFAGAGSGKTRVITYRVASLIANHQVPPYRILAVTFTNKAAGELKERLTGLAGAEIARDLWVGTFHSICIKLIKRYREYVGLPANFVIYDDGDQKALMTRIIKAENLSDREYPPKVVLSRIHQKKQAGILPEGVRVSQGFDSTMLELYIQYQKALRLANAVDFEDILLLGTQLAEGNHDAGKELRLRFDHVLVDEFQDTNQIQYRLVRALAAQSQNLCVVGDDDQSIYSWRGADIRNIRNFRKDFKSATVVKLEQNYRSSGNIVKTALAVIEQASEREPKQLFTEAKAGELVQVHAVFNERHEAKQVAKVIRSELSYGMAPNDIAVFYRTNAQSRVLETELRAQNIHHQIVGGQRFFERAEVKDLLAYLRLLVNPASDADLQRILNVPARGISPKTFEQVMLVARKSECSLYTALRSEGLRALLPARAWQAAQRFVELIEGLRGELDQFSPDEVAEHLLERSGYLELLQKKDNAESDARLENLKEAIGSIREYLVDAEKEGEPANLQGYLERTALVADIDGLNNDAPAVVLMTVHASKGLEFPAVLLTGLEEGIFPYRGLDGDRDEMEEERRLAYVAITRARQKLHLFHASSRMIFGRSDYRAPSRFLEDIPHELIAQAKVVDFDGEGYGSFSPSSARGGYSGQSAQATQGWRAVRQRIHGGAQSSDSEFSQLGDHGGGQARLSGATMQPGWASTPKKSAEKNISGDERWVDTEEFSDVSEDYSWIRPGAVVYHRRFGKGKIRELKPEQPPKIVTEFPGFGKRVLLVDHLHRRPPEP